MRNATLAWRVVLLMLPVVVPASSASAQHRVVLTNHEQPLGQIPFDAADARWLVLSGDGRRGAYVAPIGAHYGVVVDGVVGESIFQDVARDSLTFSPDGTRFAFAGRREGRWYVTDHAAPDAGEPYDDVGGSSLRFSPDSRHLAFVASRGKRAFVVLDGKLGRSFDSVDPERLVFAPGGGRLAYVARREGRTLVVLDGNERPPFDEISRPVFSGNSVRLAYAARSGARDFLVLDNHRTADARQGMRARSVALSNDGERVAYAARSPDGVRVIDGERASQAHDWVFDDSLTLSPDGARLAYVVRRGPACAVVVDETPGPSFDGIAPGSIAFSPDGRRLAYVAERAEGTALRRHVVVDGRRGAAFERIRGRPCFSPNGRHVAYLAERAEQGVLRQFVVVDGSPGKPYAWVRGEPVFSPDGSRVIFMALGPDDRFETGEELPADVRAVGAGAGQGGGRLVLDHSEDFRVSLRSAGYPPGRTRAADDAERRQRPLDVLLVEERITLE